eukprot:3844194-Rhodomonas_salina.1
MAGQFFGISWGCSGSALSSSVPCYHWRHSDAVLPAQNTRVLTFIRCWHLRRQPSGMLQCVRGPPPLSCCVAVNEAQMYAVFLQTTWGPTTGDGNNRWYAKEACEPCKRRLLDGRFK